MEFSENIQVQADSSCRGVQDDDVYPVHVFDDAKVNRKLLSWVMRFNDVLDPERLHAALSRLLEIGDWRKLGGRLRLKETGKLEIHAPTPFTIDRPAVAFTHDGFEDVNIEDHPIASSFPAPTDGPSIQPVSINFRPFLAPPGYPPTLGDMIRRHAPQVSLHVTSFRNATLVAVAWPHTLMDAVGQQALLRGWSLVLAGREQEVPRVLGARQDVLERVDDEQESPEALGIEKDRLGKLGKLALIARFLWDKFWGPRLELRAVYLPEAAFSRLQRQVRQQLAECPENTDQDRFVSEGDILTAWVTRAIASTRSASRPVTVINLFNARFRLPLLRKEESAAGIYAQNMVLPAFALLSPKLARGPLGPIALQHRRHIAQQTARPQTLSMLRAMRRDLEAGKGADFFFGKPNALLVFFNNLTKLDLMQAADFGPAVLRQGEDKEARTNPPGTMVVYWNQLVDEVPGGPDCFYMLGKDFGGSYWLMGKLRPQTWTRIGAELREME
ncbi:transcriptional regulator sdnM [Hirsutella rhossiliensis]|uniref:Transcriptional regulator sdnM n=1 Tax=Hirsutella rhossiliensis TaxID=111463 RepID=A0A9P8N915_9HYPO|nr:transcriptional regulator sdnM [Hirsutella rhossiliensis]KAH0967964.1 transcriptional regulator sdnM [Hirsutella rhossiliensis]